MFITAEIIRSTEIRGLGDAVFVYEDAADFVEPYKFVLDRVDIEPSGRDATRAKAIAEVEAERQRRSKKSTDKVSLLDYMNEVK